MKAILVVLVILSVVVNAAHFRKSKEQMLLDAIRGHVGASATTLRDAAELTGRYFGSCLGQGELTKTALINALKKDFNCITPENEMKWSSTEPNNNTWTWTGADAIFNWSQDNDFIIRGHTLVWHSQIPSWVSSLTDVSAMTEAMYNHMEVLMARYKGKIYAWDVVNEAFADDGTENLRQQSPWVKVFGNSTKFIEMAFTHARLQDPNAKLCYNDYSTDGINPKSNGVYNMVKDFKTRGVPIDCVGFQGHLNTYPTATFQQNLQRFADLGVEVYLTELDIQETTSGGAEGQAAAYSAVVGACLNVTACKGITVWGVDDGDSWKSNTSPLLLNSTFGYKPAYYSTLDVLNKAAADAAEACVAEVRDMGTELGQRLSFEVKGINGNKVQSVAFIGHDGRAFNLPKVQRHVFEITGTALRMAPLALPLTLVVTATNGDQSTITVDELGGVSSC